MSGTPHALIMDLLEWLAAGPRPYADVMEAWRTSCPRLTIWEDAVEQGLVQRRWSEGQGSLVALTEAGWAALRGACSADEAGDHGRALSSSSRG
jgi:hypothetical protein